jgi:hypothetical protein
MANSADSHQYANLASLFQQQQTNADLLLKHQLDSQEKGKEALAISERIFHLTAQVIEERYKLDVVEKEVAKEMKIIEGICCCDSQNKSSAGGMEVC